MPSPRALTCARLDTTPQESGSDECLRISDHDSYVLSDQTEIVVTDVGGGTTQFCGSQYGEGGDNPNTADELNDLQKNRAVTLSFSDKSCVTLRYSISCCITTGRNFLFAGSSRAMLPTCAPEPYRICSSDHACWRPECTEIDLKRATVRYSNLGGRGPDFNNPPALRLGGVAKTDDGRILDILITIRPESGYTPTNADFNKINADGFGIINVKAGTSVALTFTFVDAWDEEVELPCVTLSFYDFDNGAFSSEVLQVGGFDTYTLGESSELAISSDGRGETRFTSTTRGLVVPTSPTALTEQQLQRTVALQFSGVSKIDLTLEVPDSSKGGGKAAPPPRPSLPTPLPAFSPAFDPEPALSPLARLLCRRLRAQLHVRRRVVLDARLRVAARPTALRAVVSSDGAVVPPWRDAGGEPNRHNRHYHVPGP